MPYVSVVIPVYNESLNVLPSYNQLTSALEALKKPYELLFIDDGSSDDSFKKLESLTHKDKNVTVIKLRRNFGKTIALAAGFEEAKGQYVVTIDGDLQNDARDIPQLLRALETGADVASGWRYARKDAAIAKRAPSRISNLVARYLTGVNLHDFGCPLKAYKREVLGHVTLYGDVHRYLPALVAAQGYSVVEIKVRHYKRQHGRSKYGLKRLLRGPLDLLYLKFQTNYANQPLHFFGLIGIVTIATGGFLGIANILYHLIEGAVTYAGPLLLLSVLLMLAGFQFITLGIMAETVVGKLSKRGKPPYAVEKIIR